MSDLMEERDDDPAVTRYQAASQSMESELTEAGEFPGSFFAKQMFRRGNCDAAVTTIDRVAEQLTETELVELAELALVTDNCGSLHGRLAGIFQRIANESNDAAIYLVVVADFTKPKATTTARSRPINRFCSRIPTMRPLGTT